MEIYKNLGGDSGVTRYEVGATEIKVGFRDGSLYLYNHLRPGLATVEKMKALAVAGSGLNSFISRSVRKNFAAKLA
ncbi:hypothetical protein CLU95_1423 [Variovorax sp. 54]|uniref:hypothetical protein n=1 Tax=Variovorax sp. 54 TaxID=2035212 RepID=UPI000C18DDA6|nr:hypothetical protein [Variovorax sp. 54]PIF74298.1 hypothetical protein CLU95_1423 [Variovorax sp. 54]